MLKTINHYVFKECLQYQALCLFAFIGMALTLRMLKFASLIINRGVAFSQIGLVFLAIIPTFLEIAIPLSTLLGIMLAFGRLSGDSEIIVMRSSGIGIFKLLKPVALFGVLAAVLTLALTLYVSPWGYQTLSRTLLDIARTQSLAGMEPGVFNKLGALTLYTDHIDYQTGQLSNVLIDDRRTEAARKIILAKSGVLESDVASETITLHLKTGVIHEQPGNHYVITDFDTNDLIMRSDDLFDPESRKQGPGVRELSLWEIDPEIERFQALQAVAAEAPTVDAMQSALEARHSELDKNSETPTAEEIKRKLARLHTEKNRRFSTPVAALILALVALPLGIQVPRMQRAWGVGISASLGMLAFVSYYIMLSIGVTLSENGMINSTLGLWLPNIAAIIFAAIANYRIGTEQWHSLPHALETWISKWLSMRRVRAR